MVGMVSVEVREMVGVVSVWVEMAMEVGVREMVGVVLAEAREMVVGGGGGGEGEGDGVSCATLLHPGGAVRTCCVSTLSRRCYTACLF